MKRDGAALRHLPGRGVRAPEDVGLRTQDARRSIGDRIHQLTSGRNDFGRDKDRISGPCLTTVPNRSMGGVFTRGIWYGVPAR